MSNGGATWHRVDLHLHSPSISTFVSPKGTKREDERNLIDAYVGQLAAQGISVAAITDYNGVDIEWFEVAAAKAINSGITLLPGAEMTFREEKCDLHMLAIFPGDTDLEVLNTFLRSLDKDPGSPLFDKQGSHRNIDLKVSLTDAVEQLRSQFNCLLVLPHPDQPNGLCKGLKAEAAARLLTEIGPDAIEYCSEKEKKKLQSTGVLSENFWDQLALVDFSNPKRIEEIGTQCRTDGTLRATYLKLGTTNLDALRLALHDPKARLSLGGIPSATHPRIRSMAISGSGFLGNLSISWNQDLNVIIGAKGVGKSAILETLRYAFAITPYTEPSSREELVRYALGSDGKVEVILDKSDQEGRTYQYRIVRKWGESPEAFQVGPEKPVSIPPSEFLGSIGGPAIFGQGEIYAVSRSEAYQLSLLDEWIGEEVRKQKDAVAKAMEALTTNAGTILEIQGKLAKREDYGQRLKKVEHEIEIHKKKVAEKLKEVADLRNVMELLQNATHTVTSSLEDFGNRRLNLLGSLQMAHRNLHGAQSKQTTVQQDGAIVLAVLQENLTVVLDKERTLLEQAVQSLKRLDVRCQEKLHSLEEESRRIGLDGQRETPGQYPLAKLEEERTSLISLVTELNGYEDRLKTLRKERQEILHQLRDSRYIQNKLRKERAEAIAESLRNRLRLQVEFKGQKGSYKEELSSLLKGSNLSQEAIEQLILPQAVDGIAIAEAVRIGNKEIQTRFGLEPEMADRLVKWLTTEERRLFDLEMLIPQDSLQLELRIEGQYRSFNHLSEKQGAAAVLLLLFGLEGRLLILDQPDDYLDDQSIHEEILQILREQKGVKDHGPRRQIILATNDATIPVMCDAELVLPLETRDGHAHVIDQGSIDDRTIREVIENIMQGGKEAFQQRAEKHRGLAP